MKVKGQRVGFVFFAFSIFLTLTFIGPIFIPFIVESIGKYIDELFKIGNICGTSYYLSVTVFTLCFFVYILTFIKYRQYSIVFLTIFFTSILLFLNAALFYYPIRLPGSRMDGQQAFYIIDKPIKTSLLYLVFGYLHDYYVDWFSEPHLID
jgi:hypothetical protein